MPLSTIRKISNRPKLLYEIQRWVVFASLVAPCFTGFIACQKIATSEIYSEQEPPRLQLSPISGSYSYVTQNLTPDQNDNETIGIFAFQSGQDFESEIKTTKYNVVVLTKTADQYEIADGQVMDFDGTLSIAYGDANSGIITLDIGSTSETSYDYLRKIALNDTIKVAYLESDQKRYHNKIALIFDLNEEVSPELTLPTQALCQANSGECKGLSPQFACDKPYTSPDSLCSPSMPVEPSEHFSVIFHGESTQSSDQQFVTSEEEEQFLIEIPSLKKEESPNFCQSQISYHAVQPLDGSANDTCKIKVLPQEDLDKLLQSRNSLHPACGISVKFLKEEHLSHHMCDIRVSDISSGEWTTIRLIRSVQRF